MVIRRIQQQLTVIESPDESGYTKISEFHTQKNGKTKSGLELLLLSRLYNGKCSKDSIPER
ncbi:hypothetical protein Bca52824_093892 [Brassica carinata]|uniref:Uncharacterized protein n=1 Tax=Brassica carinata TaxID=52824 RepID=A0A8X7P6K7_BRACI|nr:hypothetical protein Bca52824_093892 [Brassica carinata]